jgi:hypothetical protein
MEQHSNIKNEPGWEKAIAEEAASKFISFIVDLANNSEFSEETKKLLQDAIHVKRDLVEAYYNGNVDGFTLMKIDFVQNYLDNKEFPKEDKDAILQSIADFKK